MDLVYVAEASQHSCSDVLTGDKQKAIEKLNLGCRLYDFGMISIKGDKLFDLLREEEGLKEQLKKTGLEQRACQECRPALLIINPAIDESHSFAGNDRTTLNQFLSSMIRKFLLACGIISSFWYAGINITVPMLDNSYSSITQTVSELSAIDAPTRKVWVVLAMIYILLMAGFGFGIWLSSNRSRFLRIVAILVFIYVVINFYWPPMHLRGHEATLTDTLHILWAFITILLMMLIMLFGALSMGKGFRIFTALTFVIFIVFGILIGTEAPAIAQNLPTPRIGIWERINIGAFMLWVIVFAAILIRAKPTWK